MICSKCKKDIPSTSMWYSYRSNSSTCNSCFSDSLHTRISDDNKRYKGLFVDIQRVADSIITETNTDEIKIKAKLLAILDRVVIEE